MCASGRELEFQHQVTCKAEHNTFTVEWIEEILQSSGKLSHVCLSCVDSFPRTWVWSGETCSVSMACSAWPGRAKIPLAGGWCTVCINIRVHRALHPVPRDSIPGFVKSMQQVVRARNLWRAFRSKCLQAQRTEISRFTSQVVGEEGYRRWSRGGHCVSHHCRSSLLQIEPMHCRGLIDHSNQLSPTARTDKRMHSLRNWWRREK